MSVTICNDPAAYINGNVMGQWTWGKNKRTEENVYLGCLSVERLNDEQKQSPGMIIFIMPSRGSILGGEAEVFCWKTSWWLMLTETLSSWESHGNTPWGLYPSDCLSGYSMSRQATEWPADSQAPLGISPFSCPPLALLSLHCWLLRAHTSSLHLLLYDDTNTRLARAGRKQNLSSQKVDGFANATRYWKN